MEDLVNMDVNEGSLNEFEAVEETCYTGPGRDSTGQVPWQNQ